MVQVGSEQPAVFRMSSRLKYCSEQNVYGVVFMFFSWAFKVNINLSEKKEDFLTLEMSTLQAFRSQCMWEVQFKSGEGWTKSCLKGVIMSASSSL